MHDTLFDTIVSPHGGVSNITNTFVYPNQCRDILLVIDEHALKAHHVVIPEAFLPLMYQLLSTYHALLIFKLNHLKILSFVDGDNPQSI